MNNDQEQQLALLLDAQQLPVVAGASLQPQPAQEHVFPEAAQTQRFAALANEVDEQLRQHVNM